MENQSPLRYNPQLDGLRFIAVFGVVIYHWIPAIREMEISFFFGGLVNFFFVLSSFLITRILLSAREKGIRENIPGYQLILYFLFRRTLRIFPAYYIFLLVAMLVPLVGTELREHMGMYFAYLSNYQIYLSQSWPAVSSHLWTLAVEEQFYLLWPFLIIFVPYQHLLKCLFFTIGFSILLRVWLYEPGHTVPQNILTQFSMDPFAVGSILAFQAYMSVQQLERLRVWSERLLYLGIPALILIIWFRDYALSFYISGFILSVLSMKIIEGAIAGYAGVVKSFLENRFVVFIGKISYGIYLYHLLVPVLVWMLYDAVFNYLGSHHADFMHKYADTIQSFNSIIGAPAVYFFIYAGLAVLLALISWHLVEIPINNLKNLVVLNKKGKKPDRQRMH